MGSPNNKRGLLNGFQERGKLLDARGGDGFNVVKGRGEHTC